MYDKHFPLKKIKLKTKDLKSPWITAGIKKSSKQKQRLYTKFLKNRNQKNETQYKNYKKLFESTKRHSKKPHFSKLILKYKNNIKKTRQIIKEALGKEKCNQHRFPMKILVDRKSITNIPSVAKNFNKSFNEIGPNLANKINPPRKHFHEYLKEYHTCQPENVISVNELKDAFFSLKINKSSGYDDISFNVVKKCFGVLYKPLLHIFNLSIQTGIFPDELKIASVTPIFKGCEN